MFTEQNPTNLSNIANEIDNDKDNRLRETIQELFQNSNMSNSTLTNEFFQLFLNNLINLPSTSTASTMNSILQLSQTPTPMDSSANVLTVNENNFFLC